MLKVSILLVALLGACATSFQPMGLTGGYKETEMGPNKYLVEFHGNGHTPKIVAESYASRRAQELCTEKGFSSFEVQNSDTKVRGTASTSCSRSGQNVECSTQDGVEKPVAYLIVSCKN